MFSLFMYEVTSDSRKRRRLPTWWKETSPFLARRDIVCWVTPSSEAHSLALSSFVSQFEVSHIFIIEYFTYQSRFTLEKMAK